MGQVERMSTLFQFKVIQRLNMGKNKILTIIIKITLDYRKRARFQPFIANID
jgi:hypothetical protein